MTVTRTPNIGLPIATNTWLAVPGWFYTASPEPGVAMYAERAPSAQESQAYPAGHTVMSGPGSATYPRRTWSVTNP